MKRVLLALVALALLAPAASAHPLGNFTINHLSRVAVSSDRVDVTYLLDQAEIPTFRERARLPPSRGRGLPPATVLARKRAEALRHLILTVDGRRVTLALQPGGR